MVRERVDVGRVQHDVERVEVLGQAAHLHVVAPADDDGVVAVTQQGPDGAVGDVDERTGRLDHVETARAGAGQPSFQDPAP